MSAERTRTPFDPRVIGAVVVIGVIGFIAMWALMALGPQLSSGNNAQGHALSKGVAGYAGIVDYAERAGMWVDVRRAVVEAGPLEDEEGSTLLVLTPDQNSDPDDIAALVKAHGNEPVLIVLPKWRTIPHPQRKGWSGIGFVAPAHPRLVPWARFGGREPDIAVITTRQSGPLALKGSGYQRGTAATRPGQWQALFGGAGTVMIGMPDVPLFRAPAERPASSLEEWRNAENPALLIRSANRRLYVLADPDLINNFAFASRARARTALAVLDMVAEDADAGGVAFDVTLNGLGGDSGGFLRLAFVPPFIGITLCLIAAGLFALWQAAARFGPARVPARAIPISKLALIESSAELVTQTRREADGASRLAARPARGIGARAPCAAGAGGDRARRMDRSPPPGSTRPARHSPRWRAACRWRATRMNFWG